MAYEHEPTLQLHNKLLADDWYQIKEKIREELVRRSYNGDTPANAPYPYYSKNPVSRAKN